MSKTMYLCQGCNGSFATMEAALHCPNHSGPRLGTQGAEPTADHGAVSVGPQQAGTVPLCWNSNTVALLINACIEANVNSAVSSKQQKQKQWEEVKTEFEQQGYLVPDWEFLRKKWYRLVNKFKEVKDKKSRSGSDAVSWEWFDAMEQVMGRDPNVQPVARLTTVPHSAQPLQVPQADLQLVPSTSREEMQDSMAGKISQGRKRKRADYEKPPTQETERWRMELEDRKKYREAKLDISRKKLELLERLVNKRCE